MREILESSLANMAIILFMHVCLSILIDNKRHFPSYLFPIGMITLTSVTVISLFYLPIKYGGYQFDLRLIPLVFFAIKWGWRYVIPALIITGSWRLNMGGDGAVLGVIFGMAIPVLITLFLLFFKKTKPGPISLFSLFCICWLSSDLPIVYFVQDGWNVFKEIFLVRFLSFMLTGFILYLLILNSERELKLKKRLQFYAERDPLTGLYNMRFFKSHIETRSITDKKKYIVMVDIDHFKSINDTYGHLDGDLILKGVATAIKGVCPKINGTEIVVGRYGGEEFILFIAVDSAEELSKIVSDIRVVIENTDFQLQSRQQKINVTVSIGVSELFERSNLNHAIEIADQLLYNSKENGRNKISYANNIDFIITKRCQYTG
ncbi:GGDEF domain-containing protein [Ferdinandcohnia quinoae]|uniref:Diguanylate cyclase n=1 Tax=Fredinandcohnia quinoae TaxID=2918902 RepID=A0AAW5E4Q1_9BACI|nr:diguanylate cyclase [Fredinandcohnia sp. SECRCQ15]MCH1625047.1 diguanylate cyclase [Fredinandcohnia sp. SECRCQ15]